MLALRGALNFLSAIRMRHMPRKFENLQTVLDFLHDPHAKVEDPAALLHAFARSTSSARPWLVDNQYQAILSQAIEAIRARRVELLGLAR
jgi:hypothetical protein